MPVAAITAPLAFPSSNSIGDHVLTGHDGMILENVLLHCDVPTMELLDMSIRVGVWWPIDLIPGRLT